MDRARAVALTSALTEQPAFTALVVPMTGLFLGLLLLAVALWRARAAPAWIPAALVAAVVVEIAGPPAFKARLFFALLLAALGWAGVSLLRMSDAEWHHAAAPLSPTQGADGGSVLAPMHVGR
jgi:hypothetical protein